MDQSDQESLLGNVELTCLVLIILSTPLVRASCPEICTGLLVFGSIARARKNEFWQQALQQDYLILDEFLTGGDRVLAQIEFSEIARCTNRNAAGLDDR